MLPVILSVIFFLNFQGFDCNLNLTRKLVGALPLGAIHKRYMVYLVKSQNSKKKYDEWLCGGALVSPEFVVTSAACVIDVDDIYVLAGYNIYVKEPEIYSDPCFKQNKKKVIYKCYAKEYELVYQKFEKWTYIDIAIVQTESPYNLTSTNPRPCTYVPSTIQVNYEEKYQLPGRDAVVFGWGHRHVWRKPSNLSQESRNQRYPAGNETGINLTGMSFQPVTSDSKPDDTTNYNEMFIKYAPVLIMRKKECISKYKKGIDAMEHIITKYMTCTDGEGKLNLNGKPIRPPEPVLLQGCTDDNDCMRMREMLRTLPKNETVKRESLEKALRRFTLAENRRQGICQNDHGGPLVTWRGVDEILIGVASAFRVDKESYCTGPYLYTSTQCNGLFLSCILNSDPEYKKIAKCEEAPALRGFDKVERYISWRNHPDGPADNERNVEPNLTEMAAQRSKGILITF